MGAVVLSAAAPAPIGGRWMTTGGQAIVEIAPCAGGGAWCGRIIRVLRPRPGGPAIDSSNPDPALRTRPMEGLAILFDMRENADRWRGRIYDPQSGRTYRAELSRRGEALAVTGCWGIFCRTQQWSALSH